MSGRAAITSKGQITIPVAVRRQLGLRQRDLVEFDVDGGAAILRRAPNERNPFAAYAGALGTRTDDAVEAWAPRRSRGCLKVRTAFDGNVIVALWSREVHAARRSASAGGEPKRLLVDFLVAAHARAHADRLLTIVPQRYRRAFEDLRIEP